MAEMSASMRPLAGPLSELPAAERRTAAPVGKDRLRPEAGRFEAAFLAEMLRHAGLGRMPESFNGGPGEAAFTGTLIQEYANKIAATGRLGIAEQVYESLSRRSAQ